jgi:anoctamin-10
MFPLHDHTFNKEWIKKWSTSTFLKAEDLDEIREKLGEKVSDHWPCFAQASYRTD